MQRLKIIPKIILVVVVFYAIFATFFTTISNNSANKTPYDSIKAQRTIIYQNINNPEYQKNQSSKDVIKAYRANMCKLMGEGCTDNPDDGDKNYKKSVVGGMTSMIIYPFSHQPASGVKYVFNSLSNHGLVPQQAYAVEGVGFASLQPLTNIWKLFRDISYLVLVLIIIIIGFMIMFRMKLNPQTAISIENTLPRIIITLIFITFSFAIAGFLIDLMYVLMGIGVSLVSKNMTSPNGSSIAVNDIYGNTTWDLFWSTAGNDNIWRTGDALLNLFPQWIEFSMRSTMGLILIFASGRIPIIGPLFSGNAAADIPGSGLIKLILNIITVPILGGAGFSYAGWILSIFVKATAFFTFFRIFFALFFSYVQIILMVVFAPIILLFGAIPGKHTFGFWFKNLVANLLAFPLVAILIIVSSMIVNLPSTDGYMWQPPLMSSTTSRDGSFNILVGIGILFMIPNFIKLIKKALGAEGLPGAGIGLFFGGASAAAGGAMALGSQFSGLYYAQQAFKIFKPKGTQKPEEDANAALGGASSSSTRKNKLPGG